MTRELALQMGRPVRYGGEFRSFEERVQYMVEIAAEALAPIVPAAKDGFTRYIRRDPLGLILTIAPWNYPYLTAVNTVVPGLIAGNAVILKAASQTILTGERFQAAMDKAGLPQGLFQHLVLGHDDTAKMLSGGHVDHVSFTGSVEGGRAIERAAAGTFTSIGLELGGKDPAYVRADADVGARGREPGRRRVLQLRAELLRHRAHLCARARSGDRFVEGFAALTAAVRARRSARRRRRRSGRWRRRASPISCARQTAQALAKGAKAHIDAGGLPAQPRRHALAGAAGADRASTTAWT